jgi:hypothetical protein
VSLASPPPCFTLALEWKSRRDEEKEEEEEESDDDDDHDSGVASAITRPLMLPAQPLPLLHPRLRKAASAELLLQQLKLDELDVLAEVPLALRAARSSRRWREEEEERGIVKGKMKSERKE